MPTKENQDKIREQLQKALNSSNIDYGKVLELSLQLSEFDTENVRFSVDASHISRLGRELVGRKETAVSELVKNAYDADATRVTLTFKNSEFAGGELVIDDNGHGMTREQLINGFMRLSTTDKIHAPYSPQYHRLRAGRKGIGRFAAQSLGKKLIITTQTQKADFALQVEVDWDNFKTDQELITISSHIKDVEKAKKQGTTLVISNLEDGWTIAALEKVYKYLIDLLQPFPLMENPETRIADPGFEAKISVLVDGNLKEVASAEKMIYEHALARIDGKVDENGLATWSLDSQQLEISEKEKHFTNNENTKRFRNLRNINLRAYYYIFNSSTSSFLPKQMNNFVLNLAEERGGIRVYRNGFRVLPYGETNEDWLELDSRTARRQILPPFRNRNFLGFVEIIDPQGTVFEETASREGLIENNGFHELREFIGDVLEISVIRIAEARSKKAKPTSREIPPEQRIKKAAKDLARAAKDIKTSSPHTESSPQGISQPELLELLQNTSSLLRDIATEQAEEKTVLLSELSMLRVLASLGLAIGEFTHEIRQMFSALLSDANAILEDNVVSRTTEKAQRLIQNIASLKTYAAYFDKTVSANVKRETTPQDIARIVRSFWEVVTPACSRYGIEFPEPTIQGYDLITVPMHPSEWNSILFNLFTNSYKAIVRAGRANGRGKILVRTGSERGRVFVEFADNGDGIPPENQERIFDAFFTTSLTAKAVTGQNEQEELLGTGLGLKIIKDIVTAYNGEILIIGAPRDYVTSFRIEIPKATYKQMEAYGY